jgi:hypothetical protein
MVVLKLEPNSPCQKPVENIPHGQKLQLIATNAPLAKEVGKLIPKKTNVFTLQINKKYLFQPSQQKIKQLIQQVWVVMLPLVQH